MNVSRLLLGCFGIVVAATFYVAAGHYPRAAAEMPVIYAVAVALLSLAMVLDEAVFKCRRLAARQTPSASAEPPAGDASPQTTTADDEAGAAPVGGKRWLAVVAIFALAVGYVMSLDTLGYVVGTGLFLALSLAVLGTVRWPFAVIGSVVLIAVICVVFVWFLGLPIPLLPAFV